MTHTPTPTEKALRRRLDEAEEEIERLRQLIPAQMPLQAPREWGLTRAEEKYLVALLDQKRVDKTAIYNTVYGDDDSGPEIKIVDVIVCKLRKKLKPLGINIVTVWGRGYEVEDRDAVRALMGASPVAANDNAPVAREVAA